jgi:hypothetical protein
MIRGRGAHSRVNQWLPARAAAFLASDEIELRDSEEDEEESDRDKLLRLFVFFFFCWLSEAGRM